MIYFWREREGYPWSLNSLYRVVGISKQGFHKFLSTRRRHDDETCQIVEIIRQIRVDHPTMCCRAMYFKINPVFMGRDRFETLCREQGFMVQKKRSGHRTTDSTGVVRFDNLIEGLELTKLNQVWSSDITYFELHNMFYYITFILDCFSRLIVGYQISSRLLTEQTSLPALKMAIRKRKGQIPEGIIFHSDGGGQYYDKAFLALTKKHKFQNSMCEFAYQNGKAERINGVIKNNYLKHWEINDLGQLTKQVDRAVRLYNTDKPHSCLHRKTPYDFEKELANLEGQNKPMMTESFDANLQIDRASSPVQFEQNKPQNQDVNSATSGKVS